MNAAAKLGAYAAALALVLAGGAVAGAAIGPEPDDDPPTHDAHAESTHDAPDVGAALPGLAISDRGYTLVPRSHLLPADGGAFRFHIAGPDGDVVHRFRVEHDKELHLIVASRDLERFAHVHPERGDAPGEVPFAVTFPSAGRHRLFFDFQVDGVVHTADFTVDVAGGGAHHGVPEQDGHR